MIPPVFERHPAIIPTIVCEKGRISRRTEELHGRGHIAEPSWQPAAWHAGDEGVDVHQLAQSAAHEDPAHQKCGRSAATCPRCWPPGYRCTTASDAMMRLPIADSWSPFPIPVAGANASRRRAIGTRYPTFSQMTREALPGNVLVLNTAPRG
jgi:hypothetical protein